MKKIVVLIVFFILSIFQEIQYCQVQETKGNLLRINFTKPNIDLSDTLWSWTKKKYSDGYRDARGIDIIHCNQKSYLVIDSADDNPHLPWIYTSLYDVSTRTTRQLNATHPPIDWDYYLYFQPEIRYTVNGVCFFYGRSKTADFFTADSLYQFRMVNGWRLIHAAGQIGGKELVVTESTPYDFKYYLEDFSDPPNVKFNDEVMVEDSASQNHSLPFTVQHLRDSLYLYREDMGYLYLSSFGNNKLKFLKRLKPEEPSQWPFWNPWKYVNGNLFYLDGKKLLKEHFDYSSNTLRDQEVYISNFGDNYSFSDNGNIFAHLRNDSLFVYSLNEERLLNSYNIKSIPNMKYIFIDSPYVYLHQIQLITDVPKEKSLPTQFVLKGNYPNPFNPSTTISFVLPKRERVGIKIFNSLGQLVCELINEERDAGENSIVWNGKNSNGMEAASGIYFYRVQTGKNFIMGKMVLQK